METTPKEEQNWNHFILHLDKGLVSEILGPYILKERNKKTKELESKCEGTYLSFITLSIQGQIQTLQADEICWGAKEPQPKSWEVTLKGFDGATDETDDLVKWYLADTSGQVKDDLKAKGLKYLLIEELPEGHTDGIYDVKL